MGAGDNNAKTLRKRLQRQLEFYLSESNLRQDKFLQQYMDDHGFVPIQLFLSFNKLKIMKVTEQMILDAAEKSSMIQVDALKSRIAPKVLPFEKDDDSEERIIYIDNFGVNDDHDSLRKLFFRFGKVNLVSMPRFQHNKKFKGFAFVEFAVKDSAQNATKTPPEELQGIRVMSKTRWLEMKEQLKKQLQDTQEITSVKDAPDKQIEARTKSEQQLKSKDIVKKPDEPRQKKRSGDHIRFSNDEDTENGLVDQKKRQKGSN